MQKWTNECLSISHILFLENVDQVFNTYGEMASTVSVHEVNKQSTFCICNIKTIYPGQAFWEYPKVLQESGPIFQPHLIFFCSLLLLTSLLLTGLKSHILFLFLKPQTSLFELEDLLSSLHLLVTSQMSVPQKDVTEFLLHTMLFISFLSFLSPTFQKKVFKYRNWFYSFGSHNLSLGHKMDSRTRVWYLVSNSCFCSKGAVCLGARFHL